jgi:serralysin
MLPAPTENEVIKQLVMGTWRTTNITYSFVDEWSQVDQNMIRKDDDTKLLTIGESEFLTLSISHKAAFRFVADLWRDLIVTEISESTDLVQSDFKIARNIPPDINSTTVYESDKTVAGYPEMQDAYIWMHLPNEGVPQFAAGYQAILHEFGHGIGLYHAGNYNYSADASQASSSQDTHLYTVMSYFGPDGISGGSNVETGNWRKGGTGDAVPAQTPMMNDILVIQAMYGADPTTRSDDTTYGFNAVDVLGREAVYDFSVNPYPVLCIYDADGIDTLNLSGWDTNSNISLVPGTFTDANNMTKNISIARGVIIENAVGGSGDDTFVGNAAANILDGGSGRDITIYHSISTDVVAVDLSMSGDDLKVNRFSDIDTLRAMEVVKFGSGNETVALIGNSNLGIELQMQDGDDVLNLNENFSVVADGQIGNDTAKFGNFSTSATFALGNLNDVLALYRSSPFGLQTLRNFETVILSNKADTLTLDASLEVYSGEVITYDGGQASDTLDYSLSEAGVTLEVGGPDFTSANGKIVFKNFEQLVGSSYNDTFVFKDALSSLPSTSKFDGKGGINTMDFSERDTGIQLQRLNATTLKTADGKTLTNFQKFVGTEKADSLVLLDGMKEVDGGDNVGGVDTLDIRYFTGGIATRYLETNTIVASGSGLVATGFENILYNSNQLRIMGTDNAENFTGTAGVDWIYGQGGNDIFQLSAGNDNLWGGDGDDTFYANIGDIIDGGADHNTLHVTYNGQLDTPRFSTFTNIDEFHVTNAEVFANFTSRPNLELYFYGDRIQHIGFTSGVGYKHIETGAWDDKVNAWGEGRYDGGTGMDTINLRAMGHWGLTIDKAARTVTWDNGSKSLEYVSFEKVEWGTGQNGVTVLGNDQAERFFAGGDRTRKEIYDGRGGNDTLIADNGGDELTGGSGNDTFVFNDWGSTTIVRDFDHSEDNLVLTWTPTWAFRQEVHGNDIHLWGNNSKFAILEGAAAGGNVTYTVKSLTTILNSTSGLETNAMAPSDDWMLVA